MSFKKPWTLVFIQILEKKNSLKLSCVIFYFFSKPPPINGMNQSTFETTIELHNQVSIDFQELVY
jgi:uncharacterized membrane protein